MLTALISACHSCLASHRLVLELILDARFKVLLVALLLTETKQLSRQLGKHILLSSSIFYLLLPIIHLLGFSVIVCAQTWHGPDLQ